MTFAAKKSLGQHFLFNPSTLDKIVQLAQVTEDDCVLEIGPGPGRLTEALIKKAKVVVAIEKDHRFSEDLKSRFQGNPNAHILAEDVLNFNYDQLIPWGPRWKVVANLPYNIATEIIFRLLARKDLFSSLYLMVQKEVGERLVGTHQSDSYGILSLMAQLHADTKIVYKLSPQAFTPPPKVSSVIVEFKLLPDIRYPIQDIKGFEKMIRHVFGQRRKMIKNTLRTLFPQVDEALFPSHIRPENMGLKDFVELWNKIKAVTH